MKKLITIIALLSLYSTDFGQVIFSDNFESGTGKWVLQGSWGLTRQQYVSFRRSLSESPNGNYASNLNITATMTNGVDLSTALGAQVRFWARYDIEVGLEFDNMYLEVTADGTNWIQIARFEGEGVPWTQYSFELDGFLGNNNVKIRFRFFSDPAYEVDGMYIDDFEIITFNQDLVPPLIVHDSPAFYEGSPDDQTVTATISDISGVQSAELSYQVDSGSVETLSPSNINQNEYTFIIPAQLHGRLIEYQITAVDNLGNATSDPPVHSYLSGSYIAYDDPTVSFLNPVTQGTGVAVRMTVPPVYDRLVYALIRNYTDINNPNDDFIFHVWSNNGGVPGTDLITPFTVTPEATLLITSPMTRIDLRQYENELSNLTGDFFIGFTVPSGTTNITEYSPAQANRSYAWNGSQWSSVNYDYHFRVIMSDLAGPLPVELTDFTIDIRGRSILLKWETATEVDNFGFDIERSRADRIGTAGVPYPVWEKVGFVEGAGNSNSPKEYSFTDNPRIGKRFLYRLKQIDTDGTYDYSETIQAEFTIADFGLSQNYPNPFNPSTKIELSIPGKCHVSLKIYDVLGNEITALIDEEKEGGHYSVDFFGDGLPSGIYIYTLTAGEFNESNKMILLK